MSWQFAQFSAKLIFQPSYILSHFLKLWDAVLSSSSLNLDVADDLFFIMSFRAEKFIQTYFMLDNF